MVFLGGSLFGQQIPDTSFRFVPSSPRYQKDEGGLILIDEGHHNFHNKGGRYAAFATVLENDGYRVIPHQGSFSLSSLENASILVIANAIHKDNESVTNWKNPVGSAFSDEEVDLLAQWVYDGGSLFFIADHMPFPAAGSKLAEAFGVRFYNGYASENRSGRFPGAKRELDIFRQDKGTLSRHTITQGDHHALEIPFVATFTGQAFELPAHAESLLIFDDTYDVLLPDTAWVFHASTKKIPAKGLSQGAVLKHGKGRIAVFGEAAMFTAQLKGSRKEPFGMNNPDAPHNAQFLLNIIHWLDHRSE